MVSLVSAVAPIMNTSRISPTTAYYNTNLLGYCNASDGDSDTLTYYYKWWNGTSLYENGNESVSESFSITSSTESVFNSGITYYPSLTELSDGRLAVAYRDNGNSDYGTFAICNSSGGSCTESVFNSGTTYYISLTELNDGRLAVAYRDGGNSNYGTLAITNVLTQSFTESIEYLINTLSSTYITTDEVWTFECTATDGTSNSSALNSTSKTILASDTCTYSGSGDWNINVHDNCTIESDVDLGVYELLVNGTDGILSIQAELKAKTIRFKPNIFDGTFIVAIKSGLGKMMGHI